MVGPSGARGLPPEVADVIGAGHNVLACAAYLAPAGLDVAVFEAAAQLGGRLAPDDILALRAEPPVDVARPHYVGGSCHGGEFATPDGGVVPGWPTYTTSVPGLVLTGATTHRRRLGLRTRAQCGSGRPVRARHQPDHGDGAAGSGQDP